MGEALVLLALGQRDDEMAQSVCALAIHCQAIGAARVVVSHPLGGAPKVDCSSPQHTLVYISSLSHGQIYLDL